MFEQDESLVVDGSRFAEVLESKVEAREGVFAKPHPFLRTACRGLAH